MQTNTKKENAKMLLRFVIPFWGFNAVVMTLAWFAQSWTHYSNHWSENAWEGLLATWLVVKMITSFCLIALIVTAFFENDECETRRRPLL